MRTLKHKYLCFLFVIFLITIGFSFLKPQSVFATDNYIEIPATSIYSISPNYFAKFSTEADDVYHLSALSYFFGTRITYYNQYLGTYPDASTIIISGSGDMLFLPNEIHDITSLQNFYLSNASTPDGDYWIKFNVTHSEGEWTGVVLPDVLYWRYSVVNNVPTAVSFPPQTCSDGIKNQDEADIDTGGVCYVASAEKSITAFGFQSLSPTVAGVIDESNHTISLTVPFGTNITALAPTIALSTGASVSPASGAAQDFTNPVVYTVTAENSSTQEYTVRVVIADKIRNPVIIVPGLLGTEISKPTENGSEKLWLDILRNIADIGDWFMDSLQFNDDLIPSDKNLTIGDVVRKATTAFGNLTLFDYSFSLVEEFKTQGYAEGTDLFLFPYDWRYGVSENNVDKLKQKIYDVLNETSAKEVDIIAHSTGGLIVKKYVVENPSDNKIDKAVFVGVPNTGAPKAIKALIQGDSFGVPLLADEEMKKISKNLPVAYDLLPSEQYYNVKGSYVKIITKPLFAHTPKDLNFEEADSFLVDNHKLNSQALTNARNLHTADFDNYDMRTAGIDLYALDGCKEGTISKLVEVRQDPVFADPFSTNHQLEQTLSYQLEYSPGDSTVPLESSTNLPINTENKYYALKGKHSTMMSQEGTRQKIVNIISGSVLSTKDSEGDDIITQDISKCELDGRAISVFSPLSISVLDQDGNHLGLASDGVSIENDIPNASFEIVGEHKFVYLPTDEGQTYTISVAGTGTGTFTITDATIVGNDITQTQVFSNISVTPSLVGNITLSNDTDTILSLDIDNNGMTDFTLEPSSVLDSTESQNFLPDEPSSQNNSQGDTSSSGSGSGSFVGASSVFPVVQDTATMADQTGNEPSEQIVEVVVAEIVKDSIEIPAQVLVDVAEGVVIKSTISTKKAENTDIKTMSEPEQIENLSKENILTANAADAKIPINNTVVLITIIGAGSIFLVAKNFIKL